MSRRLALAVLGGVLATGVPAYAKFDPIPLHDLLGVSDLVVLGTISQLDEDSFQLTISEVVAGTCTQKAIPVRRFKDWTCAQRWAPYANSQTVLLFLDRPTGKGLEYRIRGGGGEGEMPVVEDSVYHHGHSIKGCERGEFDIHGGRLNGYKLDRKEFLTAIREYRKCFEFKAGQQARIRQAVSAESLERFRKASALHDHLVKATQASRFFENDAE